jgi:hypothetical protein
MSDSFDRNQRNELRHIAKNEPHPEEKQDIPPKPSDPQGPTEFERELESLINRHCLENTSGTPDFILSEYLVACLFAFNLTIRKRAKWRDESVELPALQKLREGKQTVPLTTYSGGRHNDIGEAEIKVWPGEMYNGALIQRVIPVFEKQEIDNGDRSE